jgi:hypothetical protein
MLHCRAVSFPGKLLQGDLILTLASYLGSVIILIIFPHGTLFEIRVSLLIRFHCIAFLDCIFVTVRMLNLLSSCRMVQIAYP